ncbi:multicopper oxidase family protein [Virgibacillus halodenitrificans]|uniref:multicopper oxidase family protein n=1 Tax=Virgibacillus halodenitrificans TaxID=1482 RepID=UPI00045CFFC1|nr:multicopper oxidase family protein [Virgibacillus halodenitrificans]WHX27855.1 multicopper oxidase family protein [Virgibacillus halodenitrificans]CDQ37618.1 Multicopper oxidase mco [Virgibacillus halodenitrificans]
MKKSLLITFIVLTYLIVGCTQEETMKESSEQNGKTEKVYAKEENTKGKKINEFTLTAQEKEWKLSPDKTIQALTYNGTVPGEEIRVKEGEVVKVHLKNTIKEPVTIHWHGVPLSNKQDGIPGVTQDAVPQGETYTYEFVANHPGTYWYHTHQNGVEQMDKGLYGTLIVEPKEGTNVDRDYTLVVDEWESGEKEEESNDGHMGDTHGSMMEHDMSSYDIYTINGKTYDNSKPLIVRKGDRVKLRFINAGYMVHKLHIPVDYRVTHVDGQKVNEPRKNEGTLLEIAPGERYDIEFKADGEGNFTIDRHGESEANHKMSVDVVYEEESITNQLNHTNSLETVDITKLGEGATAPFSLDDEFDIEYEMDLNATMDMSEGDMGMAWTINGETFPEVPPFKVNKNDKVKVTMKNDSRDNSTHPMHLHGHFFQVLSKNGEPLKGAPIIKDTLNVKPGETYEIAFLADNPGDWLFHCHDLHHASNGMVTMVKYNNFQPFYEDTGKVDNQPE